MSAVLTERVARQFVPGWTPKHRGKVRDTYELPEHPGLLLVVATDRLSIFDFVLPREVPRKGEVLTAMNIFWRLKICNGLVEHDLVAYGADIDRYLPRELRGNKELERRAVVVRKIDMIPYECIVRGNLTGSGWKAYKKTGEICGVKLPAGLAESDEIDEPIFTPTTKAEVGHDQHVSAASVEAEYPGLGSISVELFKRARRLAIQCGIVIADDKKEFGYVDGVLVLGDEVLTPDSSRFWPWDKWKAEQVKPRAERKSPQSYDKQIVRNWGLSVGFDDYEPENPDDLARVASLSVPSGIIDMTSLAYLEIMQKLTGLDLGQFQRSVMGVTV